MKKALEFLGVILLIQGVAAIVDELTGWLHGWAVVQRVGFVSGYELYAGIALVVLAVALFAAAGSSAVAKGTGGKKGTDIRKDAGEK